MDMQSLLAAADAPVSVKEFVETLAPVDLNQTTTGNSFLDSAKTAIGHAQSSAATALQSAGRSVAGDTGASAAIPVALGLAALGVFFAVKTAKKGKKISFGKKSSSFKIGK